MRLAEVCTCEPERKKHGPACPLEGLPWRTRSLAELLKQPPKYRAKRTSCGLHVHASKKEAARCRELQLLKKAFQVTSLEFQPRYDLVVNGIKICSYVGDFRYREWVPPGLWSDIIVEDCKGFKTPAYRLKKKLMLACFGIEIRET